MVKVLYGFHDSNTDHLLSQNTFTRVHVSLHEVSTQDDTGSAQTTDAALPWDTSVRRYTTIPSGNAI